MDVSGDAVLDAVSAFVVGRVGVGSSEDGDEASDGGQVEFSVAERAGVDGEESEESEVEVDVGAGWYELEPLFE